MTIDRPFFGMFREQSRDRNVGEFNHENTRTTPFRAALLHQYTNRCSKA